MQSRFPAPFGTALIAALIVFSTHSVDAATTRKTGKAGPSKRVLPTNEDGKPKSASSNVRDLAPPRRIGFTRGSKQSTQQKSVRRPQVQPANRTRFADTAPHLRPAIIANRIRPFIYLKAESTGAAVTAVHRIRETGGKSADSRIMQVNLEVDEGWNAVGNAKTGSSDEIGELIEQLADADVVAREEAVTLLSVLGTKAKAAVPALAKTLGDDDLVVRAAAAGALWDVDHRADLAVPVLTDLLKKDMPGIRTLTAYVLGTIGSKAEPALPELHAALSKSNGMVRLHVTEAILKIDSKDAAAANALVEMLEHIDSGIRCQAAYALGGINSEKSAQIVSPLSACLSDDDEAVRSAAAQSLAVIQPDFKNERPAVASKTGNSGPESRVQELVQALDAEQPWVREEAIAALASMGDEAIEALPVLARKLEDADPVVRASAAGALWELTHEADAVTPVLIELLNSERPGIRTLACFILENIGPEAFYALPALERAFEISEGLIRIHVAEAMVKIDSKNPKAAAVLLTSLNDSDADVRRQAAYTLGTADTGSDRRIVPALTIALNDESQRVRSAASLSLRTLGEDVPELLAQADSTLQPSPKCFADTVQRALVPKKIGTLGLDISYKSEPVKQIDETEKCWEEREKRFGNLIAAMAAIESMKIFKEAQDLFHGDDVEKQYQAMGFSRTGMNLSMLYLEAPGSCHRELFFEEINTERYGFSYGFFHPLVSAAHFFGSVPLLPYKAGLSKPKECKYTLGHFRPGDCVPFRHHTRPLRLDAGTVQAGVVTGLFFAIP